MLSISMGRRLRQLISDTDYLCHRTQSVHICAFSRTSPSQSPSPPPFISSSRPYLCFFSLSSVWFMCERKHWYVSRLSTLLWSHCHCHSFFHVRSLYCAARWLLSLWSPVRKGRKLLLPPFYYFFIICSTIPKPPISHLVAFLSFTLPRELQARIWDAVIATNQ